MPLIKTRQAGKYSHSSVGRIQVSLLAENVNHPACSDLTSQFPQRQRRLFFAMAAFAMAAALLERKVNLGASRVLLPGVT
jgi:hypothetical protein